MKDKTLCKIFGAIAYQAMEANLEIVLENGKNKSKSSSFRGALTQSEVDYDSLKLHIFKPVPGIGDNEENQTEEDQEDEA